MTDIENNVDEQEVVAPETNDQTNEAQSQEDSEKGESDKEINFRRLREERDKERNDRLRYQEERDNERNERLRYQAELERLQSQSQEGSSFDGEDLITYDQFNKILDERERAAIPDRMRLKYSDFDDVLSSENIKEFEKSEPMLAAGCANSPNPYEASYRAIKKLILSSKKEKEAIEKEKKIASNNEREGDLNSSVTKGPSKMVGNYRKYDRKELYREMLAAKKRF